MNQCHKCGTTDQNQSYVGLPCEDASSFAILFIADIFHPVHIPAVNEFLNGDMAHSVGRGGAVPMLHTRRRPDHITRPYLPLVAIPFLHPTYARHDDQNLPDGMSMPGGACARFKGDV